MSSMRGWLAGLVFLTACAKGFGSSADRTYEEFLAKIEREKTEQEAAEKRYAECRPPWGYRNLSAFHEAERARERDRPIRWQDGVSTSPDRLYAKFEAYARELPPLREKRCEIAGIDKFDREWAYLQDRERQRLAEQGLLMSHNAEQAKLRAEAANQLRQEAIRHGYEDALVGSSLTALLNEIVDNAASIADADRIAIELGGDDGDFVAAQVLPNGQARFTSDYAAAQILLRGYKGAVYEGTTLGALDLSVVRIAGVTTYATAIGGTAQAFIVEPAW